MPVTAHELRLWHHDEVGTVLHQLGSDAITGLDPAEGKLRATIETQPLEAINTVLDRLRRGAVQDRVVLDLG
jgi:D-arabinose 1-dehydrogenase-like Zn-dependent alcohol dehydrogenase